MYEWEKEWEKITVRGIFETDWELDEKTEQIWNDITVRGVFEEEPIERKPHDSYQNSPRYDNRQSSPSFKPKIYK